MVGVRNCYRGMAKRGGQCGCSNLLLWDGVIRETVGGCSNVCKCYRRKAEFGRMWVFEPVTLGKHNLGACGRVFEPVTVARHKLRRWRCSNLFP